MSVDLQRNDGRWQQQTRDHIPLRLQRFVQFKVRAWGTRERLRVGSLTTRGYLDTLAEELVSLNIGTRLEKDVYRANVLKTTGSESNRNPQRTESQTYTLITHT